MNDTTVVLIVDDEIHIINALKRVFRRMDCEVLSTTDPEDAISIINHSKYDIVICDYNMPGINGIEVLRHSRQVMPYAARVLMTGHSDINIAISAINEGSIFYYITKPWTTEQLSTMMQRAKESKIHTEDQTYLYVTSNNITDHLTGTIDKLSTGIDNSKLPLADDEEIHLVDIDDILYLTAEAGDVLIIVRDDGRGLSREKILKKAMDKGLIHKPESEMTDKEVFNLILLPSFSTKEGVTEFSGRGVGMDVVAKNIEAIGGSILVDSVPNAGTAITLKIPLTLAIIDGMNIKVGETLFTLPTISIIESFRPGPGDTFTDPDGNEMIMVRGSCYPILRLHRYYKIPADADNFDEGILIMVEHDEKRLCIFADELLGQQQIVVKSLPEYIRSFRRIKGLAGCTLLGDGNISLILDIGGLIYDRKIC